MPGVFIVLACNMPAQTLLSLSSASTIPNGTTTLSLSLTSPAGVEPAAIQWTFNYQQDQVTNMAVFGGPALANANKSLTCNLSWGAYTCIAWGLNNQVIANGIVASVSLSVATASVTIGLSNTLAASPDAVGIPITPGSGSVSIVPSGPFTVSGQVTVSGVGLSGVTVNINGTQSTSTTTDMWGNYAATLPGSGPYTLSAAALGFSFSAPVTFANLSSNQIANFTGAPVSGLAYYPVQPCRVADTRPAAGFPGPFGAPALAPNVTRSIPILSSSCGIPVTSAAYSLNITVVTKGYLGILTIWPAGQPVPNVSTLNSYSSTSTALANAAIVPAGTGGAVSVYATDAVDLVIDINGYFAPPGVHGLSFYPVTPCRVVDTRVASFQSGFGPPWIAAGAITTYPIPFNRACGIPATAAAYSLNVTAVPRTTLGFLSIWPAGQAQPNVSTLNVYSADAAVANAAIVPAGTNGAINTFVTDATDLVIDINGYFAPPDGTGLKFYPVMPCRVADTRVGLQPSGLGGPSMAAGSQRSFQVPQSTCGIAPGAGAYSLHFTAVPKSSQLGVFAAWPAGLSMPNVSTMNSYGGGVVSNTAIVRAGTGGAISLSVSDLSDVLFDINGYFAP